MLCKDVEIVVEQEGLAPLPEAARAHVAACSHCQEFVGDLAAIVSVAKELPAEVAPPARVWASTICFVAALWRLQLWAC